MLKPKARFYWEFCKGRVTLMTFSRARNVGVAGGVGSGFAESLFWADPAEAGAGVDAFEVDPSLYVFGKSWATQGREFEIDASEVNLGKSLFMSELATHLRRRTEEARYGWLAVGSMKTGKNANGMHSDGSPTQDMINL